MTISAYPLAWPIGWKRTAPSRDMQAMAVRLLAAMGRVEQRNG